LIICRIERARYFKSAWYVYYAVNVMPVEAGLQGDYGECFTYAGSFTYKLLLPWIPALAGMTK